MNPDDFGIANTATAQRPKSGDAQVSNQQQQLEKNLYQLKDNLVALYERLGGVLKAPAL